MSSLVLADEEPHMEQNLTSARCLLKQIMHVHFLAAPFGELISSMLWAAAVDMAEFLDIIRARWCTRLVEWLSESDDERLAADETLVSVDMVDEVDEDDEDDEEDEDDEDDDEEEEEDDEEELPLIKPIIGLAAAAAELLL